MGTELSGKPQCDGLMLRSRQYCTEKWHSARVLAGLAPKGQLVRVVRSSMRDVDLDTGVLVHACIA